MYQRVDSLWCGLPFALPIERWTCLPKSPRKLIRCVQRHGGISTLQRHMTFGTVTEFDSRKGFGFIQPDDGGRYVFLHSSALERAGLHSLSAGQRVSYEVSHARGRESVSNLVLVS
jgi:cold shock protein